MSAIGYVMQDRVGVCVGTPEWSGRLTRLLKSRMRMIADAAVRFAETVSTAVKREKENSVSVSKEEVNRRAERMLTEYGNSILRLAYTYLHNYSDAEEVVQDTLIQFLRTAPQLTGTEHEKAWLLHVAANLSKNRIAYNKVRAADELSETLVAEEREDLSFVWDAVKKLPQVYRETVHLYYEEGYATAEIARILGRKESTVRSDLRRARAQLKEMLKEVYDFE